MEPKLVSVKFNSNARSTSFRCSCRLSLRATAGGTWKILEHGRILVPHFKSTSRLVVGQQDFMSEDFTEVRLIDLLRGGGRSKFVRNLYPRSRVWS